MLQRAGMCTYAVAYLLGVLYVQQLSVLPDMKLLSAVLLCMIILQMIIYLLPPLKHRSHTVPAITTAAHPLFAAFASHAAKRYITLTIFHIIMINIGIMFSSYVGYSVIKHRLPDDLAGVDIVVTGKVVSVPVRSSSYFKSKEAVHVQRFLFDVSSFDVAGPGHTESAQHYADANVEGFPRHIRLSWHNGTVRAGEYWRMKVRLKPPHGFMNPGGFDYEAWLFQQGIHATGYVRNSDDNKQLVALITEHSMGLIGGLSVNRLRENISQRLDVLAVEAGVEYSSAFALVKALAIGDKSSISSSQWQTLTNTGTSHLMAISGLHISLASLFAYLLIRYSLPVWLMKRMPSQHIALLGGLLVALLYASIAGFAVPTQRAFIMLTVLVVMTLLRRNTRPVDTLGMALFVVLLLDPLAVLSAGFWFSFAAVAVIFISLSDASGSGCTGIDNRQEEGQLDDKATNGVLVRAISAFSNTLIKWLSKWIRLQLLISVLLLPLSLFMFQQASLVSPLANLLLIPYVSFLVVPLILLALITMPFETIFSSHFLSDWLFIFAAGLLDLVWPSLSYLSELPFALWVNGSVGIGSLLMVTGRMR